MLIQFFPQPTIKKPFKFYNFWTNNANFINIISNVWLTMIPGCKSFQIQEKLKLLKPVLKKELHHTPIQVSMLQAESNLTTAQAQLHQNPLDPLLVNLESSMATRYKETKANYASYIQQQAKLKWIQYGDDNTKLFLNSIKEQRSHNMVNIL